MNVQRFRGGLVLKADRLRITLNSRPESNKEEEEELRARETCLPGGACGVGCRVECCGSRVAPRRARI